MLPIAAKVRIAKLLSSPVVGRAIRIGLGGRVVGAGGIFDASRPGFTDSTLALIFFGFYESAERRFVRQFLPRNHDVIELGASLGIVTNCIRKHTNKSARIVSVEADPTLARSLAIAMDDAGARQVVVEHGAVDYASSGATVGFNRGADNLSGFASNKNDASHSVPRLTLSQVIEKHEIGTYSLVCDIEGSEAGILFSDATALKNARSVIIELHDTTWQGSKISCQDMQEEFIRLGFTLQARYGPVCAFARP